ncbi:MAG TPA: GAF domain-containing protein [Clostridia bacterium]|nr:GAF domain-containing protein [Clostridia bacterium]
MPTRKTRPVTGSSLATDTDEVVPPVESADARTLDGDALLVRAVEEAARLLDADGAMVYLLDPSTGVLRFAHDAGIRSERSRRWVRRIELPIGVGLFGRAVAERGVVKTDDYPNDPSFRHASDTDRVVEDVGIRSMVAAPLIGGGEVFGALGTFSSRVAAFDPAQIALVRALADHAAAAMANARLIEALDRSRRDLAQRATIERSLREIAARISSALDLDAVLQLSVDEATRLIDADGAVLDLLDPETGILHWAYDSGLSEVFTPEERADLWIELGVGATGRALAEDRVIVAGDDLTGEFPASPQSELFFGRTGFRSMIAAPIVGESGRLGVIEVYSRRPDAFSEGDGQLIAAIASQAAIAITNARLIEALARSREEHARVAEAERALREIAARMTAMRDQDEILKVISDEAARLLRGSGSMINLVGTARLADSWTHEAGRLRIRDRASLLREVTLEEDAGVSGLAYRTREVQWTDDYLRDERFIHTDERDAFVRETGIRSVISAPLVRGDEVLGVLTVYADPPGAFGPADAALLGALANQGAVTIMNARLIDELERSREEVARRADAERTLREIAARVSAILEPGEVLQGIVDEAARLLVSDGARIDLYDADRRVLRWGYAAGDAMRDVPDWAVEGGLKPRQGVAGLAFAEQQSVLTDDYATDDRFDKTPGITSFVEGAGIRAVLAAPLADERGPIGTISVVSRTPGAYRPADAELLTGLATQASIALTNARLMKELEGSRAVIERRAAAEQALREIATRITAIVEPGDLLQHVVEESARLLRADGAMIDLFDPGTRTLRWAYDAGLPDDQREAVQDTYGALGEGVSGKAVVEGRVIVVDDYLASPDFVHTEESDRLAEASGIRSLIAAPIIGEEGPLGAIEVFRHEPGGFDATDAAVLGGLADQAAVAMTNAGLIAELARSRAEVEQRAERERSLRDITARITSLRDPREILERVVEEARRLLGSDGAHLTRMAEDGSYLVPVVVAGADPHLAEWIKTQEFPIGGGINGLAAQEGAPVWTADYPADPRIPLLEDDLRTAERLALRGMAAAPLRSPAGGVIGTLAISYREPRAFDPEEVDLLQGLADQAAVAIANSTLLERLTASEGRYRHLVQNSPDLIWSVDQDAKLTFVSDTCERLTGWRPEELLGKHFGALVHPSSQEVAEFNWVRDVQSPAQEIRGRVNLLRRDGSALPAEFLAMATLDAGGQFVGANGSVRDMTETDRLERELRESENRYRDLASSSPDIVFSTDPDGRYTFLSDAAEKLMGWDREQAIGRPFTEFVPDHALPIAAASYEALRAAPDQVQHARIPFRNGAGVEVPLEINVIGSLEDGRLSAIHGVARDVSERERLERELQESEARFRQLVQTTPDVIWRADAEGRFTFVADRAEELFGWRPDEIVGQHFGFLTLDESMPEAGRNWEQLAREPDVVQHRNYMQRRKDGTTFRAEVTAVGLTEDGKFVGGQGTVRDISERERLERELRESEERYRYLVSASPDVVWVTNAEGRITFVSQAVEAILGRSPDEVTGRMYWEVFGPQAERGARARFRWLARHPTRVHRARIGVPHADGHNVVVEINGIGMVYEGGFVGAHGAARDVSERDRLERDLRRQAGELASSEERAHLARELHDSVTQALFSMTLVARSVELLLERDPEAARTQLSQLRDLQREALAEMRALIFELRPGNVEQDGLVRALRTHSAGLQGRIGLPIVVDSEVDERLPLEIEETLYRISQEALHNVVKHAAARQVRLELRRVRDGIQLRIEDDGKGFDPATVPDGHLGLAGMRARAAKIDATLECRSQPGRGTTIEVLVPDAVLDRFPASSRPAGASPSVR